MLGAEAPKPPSSVGKGPAEVLGRSPPAGAFAVRLPPPPPPGSARVTTEAPLPKPFLHSLFFFFCKRCRGKPLPPSAHRGERKKSETITKQQNNKPNQNQNQYQTQA